MGNISSSIKKLSFEDIQFVLNNKLDDSLDNSLDNSYFLINTLNSLEQECLIPNTVPLEKEEIVINEYIKMGKKNKKIIIYGKNSNDEKIFTKYFQLQNLGFYNIYVYLGGLFEWLLLQDVYGFNEFPTTKKEMDLLKYKPSKKLNIRLLQY